MTIKWLHRARQNRTLPNRPCTCTATCRVNGQWPGCVSYKQVNKYIRTVIWRRVAELGLRGAHFKQIPDQVNADLAGNFLVICNAPAAPLANLFAFLAHGHPQCTFVDQAHLALYADLQFWQYGLLAFCSVCCACNTNKLLRTIVLLIRRPTQPNR